MAKTLDWQSRIGRRVRLRDLHIFFEVAERGSMAKAGAHLGITQPGVSKAIGDLEAAVGVRLLDRTPRGVEATVYGRELLKYGGAAFADLREGIKSIENLADPETGEVRIGCDEIVVAGFLPAVIERFSARYPRVVLSLIHADTNSRGYAVLQERKADVTVASYPGYRRGDLTEAHRAEILYYDQACLAAAAHSSWARRRNIDFADLADAVFIMPPAQTAGANALSKVFHAAGLPAPRVTVTAYSVDARKILTSMADRFVVVLPASTLRFNAGPYPLKELPLELPAPPWPTVCVTLKNQTVKPAVERFIACAREVGSAMRKRLPEGSVEALSRQRTTKPR